MFTQTSYPGLRGHFSTQIFTPFCSGQQFVPFCFFAALPLDHDGVCFRSMQYSPLLGGFAVVLADGRGGFLSASTASFESSVGIWEVGNCSFSKGLKKIFVLRHFVVHKFLKEHVGLNELHVRNVCHTLCFNYEKCFFFLAKFFFLKRNFFRLVISLAYTKILILFQFW
mgnify:CR=1 FL=1